MFICVGHVKIEGRTQKYKWRYTINAIFWSRLLGESIELGNQL